MPNIDRSQYLKNENNKPAARSISLLAKDEKRNIIALSLVPMPARVIGIRLIKITIIIAELKYKKSTFADTAKNKRYIWVIEQNHTRRDIKNRIRPLQGL